MALIGLPGKRCDEDRPCKAELAHKQALVIHSRCIPGFEAHGPLLCLVEHSLPAPWSDLDNLSRLRPKSP